MPGKQHKYGPVRYLADTALVCKVDQTGLRFGL